MARHVLLKNSLRRARSLRRDLTDAERKLWACLRAERLEGSSFRRQAPIGPYFADFVCHAAKLIIEVDGSQHGEAPGLAYDERRDAWFRSNGYRVLRFWNNDVLDNIEGVATVIVAALQEQA